MQEFTRPTPTCEEPSLPTNSKTIFTFNITYGFLQDYFRLNGYHCLSVEICQDIYSEGDFEFVGTEESNGGFSTKVMLEFVSSEDYDVETIINIQNLLLSYQNLQKMKIEGKSP